jgi:hypothetical protein
MNTEFGRTLKPVAIQQSMIRPIMILFFIEFSPDYNMSKNANAVPAEWVMVHWWTIKRNPMVVIVIMTVGVHL